MTDAREYDIVIVGGGLAGLTAGLFAARHGHSTLVLEATVPGGHLINIEKIEDFPGFPEGIAGYDLGPAVQEQASNYGAEFALATAHAVIADGAYWLVQTTGETYLARAVIAATGSHPRQLGVPGEAELVGKGVSHCASCDGPLFRGKAVGVVGGGDSALQEALTLADFAATVHLFQDGPAFSAQATYQQRVRAQPIIQPRTDTRIEAILGDVSVTGVRIRDQLTSEMSEVALAGVFVYVGLAPNTAWLRDVVALDANGLVPTDVWMRTGVPGIFAVGDIRQDSPAQAITSAGDGAVAAIAAHRYLTEHFEGGT